MGVNEASHNRSHHTILIILVLVALAIRIAIALCDVSTLVTKAVSDDSFYYFQLARNAAAGSGITFDGVENANGFHPLWFVVLLPVYLLFGKGLVVPLHIALVMEALLDVGAGFLIYLLVRALTKNPMAGILGAAVYLLNPSVILHSVNGLETGLNLFCFCLYFWFYLRMVTDEKYTTGNILVLGILSGILMLVRTDNFIIVGITYFHLVFMRFLFRKPGAVAASIGLAALVVSPWVIWNLVTFSTIMQSSASAYGMVIRNTLQAQGMSGFQIYLQRLSQTFTLFIWTIPSDVFGWGKLLGILAGLAVGITLADEQRTERVWSAARTACVPLFAFLVLAVTHSLIRGTLKSWYFMPAAAVGALFFGIFCGAFDFSGRPSARSRIVAGFLAAVILSGFALNGWMSWTRGMFPWQKEQLMAAQWVKENVDSDDWVGSFNAGIIGYMSERKVINLDGLANNSVVPYLKKKRLWDYVEKRDIGYLVDSDYSIQKDYRDFYGPDWRASERILRIATIDDPSVSWAGANVGVYRVIP